MTAAEARHKLSRITRVLLNEEVDFLALKNALEDYKELLLTLSELDYNDRPTQENIVTQGGEAIGPKWAGMCLEDLARTKAFVRGICQAVEERKEEKKDKPIVVLYTGTGPFATLILPLLTRYSPDELKFLLLEINPISVASLKKVVSGLKASEYVVGIYQEDALSFEIPNPYLVDIVIIECLQRALAKEPQVAIAHHLVPQLKENVILIPEQIRLHLALFNHSKMVQDMEAPADVSGKGYYENLDTVFVLNKEMVGGKIPENKKGSLEFDEKLTLFTQGQLNENSSIAVTTEITVYDQQKLAINDSALTLPKLLVDLQSESDLKGVKTKYVVSESPGLQTTIIR